MQYRESLFQISGSNALKAHTAPNSARIIEFPKPQSIKKREHGDCKEPKHGIHAFTSFAHGVIRACDEAFSVSEGTAKGIGPRFASKRESAFIIGTCALTTFLMLLL